MNIEEQDTQNTLVIAQSARGAGVARPHQRAYVRAGGELAIDIAGPFPNGLPVSSKPVGASKTQLPKYILVGVFIPFNKTEADERYERELEDRRTGGGEGPLQREDRVSDKKQSVNYVEILNSRRAGGVIMALRRMVVRINGEHRCQAVYRVHFRPGT